MKTHNYINNFKKRSIYYFLIGVLCASLDFILFNILYKIFGPFFSNTIAYSIGSICSFILNKKITFKSKNSKLSALRFISIVLIGLTTSQIIIFLGLSFFELKNYISEIKFVAMCASALIQYLGNTLFGSNIKKQNV